MTADYTDIKKDVVTLHLQPSCGEEVKERIRTRLRAIIERPDLDNIDKAAEIVMQTSSHAPELVGVDVRAIFADADTVLPLYCRCALCVRDEHCPSRMFGCVRRHTYLSWSMENANFYRHKVMELPIAEQRERRKLLCGCQKCVPEDWSWMYLLVFGGRECYNHA